MGLISEEIKIKWKPKTRKYYENLGYLYTRMGDTFIININDLPKNTSVNISLNVRCDACGNNFPVTFYNYKKHVHLNGLYYCNRCAMNGNKKWVSFAEWGINEFGNDFLDRYWDYELNETNPHDITKCYNGQVFIKCQEKEYHGSYKVFASNFYNGARCGFCNSNSSKSPHKYDSLGYLYLESLRLWSDKNNKNPYEYSPHSTMNVWWKCENGVHNDYEREIYVSNRYNFRCPFCVQERRESFLQEKVRLYLESFDADVYHENNCSLSPRNIIKHKNVSNPGILFYDNEIVFDNNVRIFIEVHGEQHYELRGLHEIQSKRNNTTPKYEFKYQKKKDVFKKQYVLDNGFNYLEIPYWADDDDETWKQLIDDKINEVLNS